jgi:hypothetical protein
VGEALIERRKPQRIHRHWPLGLSISEAKTETEGRRDSDVRSHHFKVVKSSFALDDRSSTFDSHSRRIKQEQRKRLVKFRTELTTAACYEGSDGRITNRKSLPLLYSAAREDSSLFM